MSGLQFLEDVNLGTKDVWVGKHVRHRRWWLHLDGLRPHACCAWAPKRSIMTYRRSIQEIPVEELELEEAEIEGVEIMYMVSPDSGHRRRNGKVVGIE